MKQVWKTDSGIVCDTQEQADDEELIDKAADRLLVILKDYRHSLEQQGKASELKRWVDLDRTTIRKVCDLLIMTEGYASLQGLLNGKGVA